MSKSIHFAVTCETSDADKNSEYGYNQVLRAAGLLGKGLVRTTEAFTVTLVTNYDPAAQNVLSEKVRITEDNYSDALKQRLADFAKRIKENKSRE